jgi:hypothetical protein
MSDSLMPVAILFCSEADWPEYCRISTDPIFPDYGTYLKAVEEFCQRVAAQGGRAVKIDVDPAALLAWCRARGVEVNARSRADYAFARLVEINRK